MWVNLYKCGRTDQFLGYERSFFVKNFYKTQRGVRQITARKPDDQNQSEQSYGISSETEIDLFKMLVTKIQTTITDDISDITSCDSDMCSSGCGAAGDKCDEMWASAGLYAGSPTDTSQVLHTTDGWATHTVVAGVPFAAGEAIAAIRCIQVDRTTTRLLAVRGTTDAGNPMEIGYSDDDGVTWTNVNVGAVNGQYALGPKSIFVISATNIWLAATSGYLYQSTDYGLTWTARHSGTLTAQNLYAVNFSDANNGWAVGANNAILNTTDGGMVWSLIAGPAAQAGITIQSVFAHSNQRVWIGYADGKLYYTHNGGTNWYRRQGWTGDGAAALVAFDWYDEYIGAFAWKPSPDAIGYLLYTIDGGKNWERLPFPLNNGVTSLHVCSPTLIFASGDAYGGFGQIFKISGG